MTPKPIFDNPCYKASEKLKGKVALITGGDSGIGRAIAIAFAKEGANVAISYLYEEIDAKATKSCVEGYGSKCILYMGDISSKSFCKSLVDCVVKDFGKIDILINFTSSLSQSLVTKGIRVNAVAPGPI